MTNKNSQQKLAGYFEVVHSPDDGGYYAELWWTTVTSPVYRGDTGKAKAYAWAEKHGGTIDHSHDPQYKRGH